jgi:D-alanine-D-alanine ligase
MFLTIGFVFNLKKAQPSLDQSAQEDAEFDSPEVVNSLKQGMEKLGHKVLLIEADKRVYEQLKRLKSKIDLVFSIAEGPSMDAREAWVPMICEWLKIPYAFSRPTVHALGLDKTLAKAVAVSAGVRTPWSVKIDRVTEIDKNRFKYPLILKPNQEGSSKGIFDNNIVNNIVSLRQRLKPMLKNFTGVMAEEYIDGREFTVSLLGNEPEVLPIVEQKFGFMPKRFHRIAGYELKWLYEDTLKDPRDAYICPAELTAKQKTELSAASVKIFRSCGVFDCARIDWRMDKKGKLYFLEINTLPGLNFSDLVVSYFPISCKAAGYKIDQVLARIIGGAVSRYKLRRAVKIKHA